MATVEQRVSYIEGRLESLATKADLAKLETRLVKWMIGMMGGSIVAASSIALLIQRFLD